MNENEESGDIPLIQEKENLFRSRLTLKAGNFQTSKRSGTSRQKIKTREMIQKYLVERRGQKGYSPKEKRVEKTKTKKVNLISTAKDYPLPLKDITHQERNLVDRKLGSSVKKRPDFQCSRNVSTSKSRGSSLSFKSIRSRSIKYLRIDSVLSTNNDAEPSMLSCNLMTKSVKKCNHRRGESVLSNATSVVKLTNSSANSRRQSISETSTTNLFTQRLMRRPKTEGVLLQPKTSNRKKGGPVCLDLMTLLDQETLREAIILLAHHLGARIINLGNKFILQGSHQATIEFEILSMDCYKEANTIEVTKFSCSGENALRWGAALLSGIRGIFNED